MVEWYKPIVKRASEEADEWAKRTVFKKLCNPQYIDEFLCDFHESLLEAQKNILARYGEDEIQAHLNSDSKRLQIELIKEAVEIMAKN